jgi:myo-inositol-1(or 4)-monophosphatase
MSQYLEAAIEAAKLAGEIQRRFYNKEKKIEFKGAINLVTEVDKQSEKTIVDHLLARFPTHSILAEEGSNSRASSPFKWVIDPLDGTTNYAHNYPFFCVSIALEKEGEMIAGVVYHPLWEELFVAERGSGAFLNGERIAVSKVDHLLHALLTTGFPYDLNKVPQATFDYFKNFINSAQAVRRDGSAALDLCYLAMGRIDGFWEQNLNPWDTAAGLVIVEEAGGKVTDFKASPYSIYEKEILASNGLIHEQMRKQLE